MSSPVGAQYSGVTPPPGIPSGDYSSPTPPPGSTLPGYSSTVSYPGAAAAAASILAVAGAGGTPAKPPPGYPRSNQSTGESPSHPFVNSPEMVGGTPKTPASNTVSPRTTPSHVPASLYPQVEKNTETSMQETNFGLV